MNFISSIWKRSRNAVINVISIIAFKASFPDMSDATEAIDPIPRASPPHGNLQDTPQEKGGKILQDKRRRRENQTPNKGIPVRKKVFDRLPRGGPLRGGPQPLRGNRLPHPHHRGHHPVHRRPPVPRLQDHGNRTNGRSRNGRGHRRSHHRGDSSG